MNNPRIDKPSPNLPNISPDPDQVREKLQEGQGLPSVPDQLERQQPTDIFASTINNVLAAGQETAGRIRELLTGALTGLAEDAGSMAKTMNDLLGPFFNEGLVGEIRNRILQSDFSFLPQIDFTAQQNAIFDASSFTVQLPAQLAASPVQSGFAFVQSITDFISSELLNKQVSSDALFGSLFLGSAQGSPAVSGVIGDPIGDAIETGRRLDDVLNTITSAPGAVLHGGIKTLEEGVQDSLTALGHLFAGQPVEALGKLGEVALSPLQLIFDSACVLLVGAASAVQTLVGAEKPGRPLNESEIETLRKVYGDSIDYDQVRVKEDVGGVLGLSGRAFTIGNTIYVPEGDTLTDRLLVHESGHVWQFQNGGLDYISDALIGRYLGGEGYNVGLAITGGKSWDELNPEQQAELLEVAFSNGIFDEGNENLRLMVRVTDTSNPDAGPGFEVIVVEEGSPEFDQAIADGFVDATDQAREGQEQAQAGQGAT